MGIKDLWSILTPYAERKPLSELRGKTVAIDLSGWVCESLNVVDYFVHPRQHLKNLFFRTCYLIWAEVTPVFVLEGTAPTLKSNVIAKRNEIQFRGVKPKENTSNNNPKKTEGRSRFNHVLKQCETLLGAMGIECVQAPGEAEAYCAFLNKMKLVDGVISQDSDCFAYGAIRVYRNFSVSTQGNHAAQGGAVDIYDMEKIKTAMDFGQNKIIVMALLCGCDYSPEGINGVGRDGVLKLFDKYKENEILDKIRCWRNEDSKYSALEMRACDKNICSNCGHLGRTQAHTKSGCGICRTHVSCDETLWRNQRLSIIAEITLRKKALNDPLFPCEEIIKEFTTEPEKVPNISRKWKQPNIVKFIKQSGKLLQWTEIYCFVKFFPILTRWQVRYGRFFDTDDIASYVKPKEIIKKRIIKGEPSLEIVWQDEKGLLKGLIPEEQFEEYKSNEQGVQKLWTTVEPLNLVEAAYPTLVENFFMSKLSQKRSKPKTKKSKEIQLMSPLENLKNLAAATEDIAQGIKSKPAKKTRKPPIKGLQKIDNFLKRKEKISPQCSTPNIKYVPSDLESDEDEINISDVINDITERLPQQRVSAYTGRALKYESVKSTKKSKDDLDLLKSEKYNQRLSIVGFKRSMDNSFDILVKAGNALLDDLEGKSLLKTHTKRFKLKHNFPTESNGLDNSLMINDSFEKDFLDDNAKNTSYFFLAGHYSHEDCNNEDAFEKAMEDSFLL